MTEQGTLHRNSIPVDLKGATEVRRPYPKALCKLAEACATLHLIVAARKKHQNVALRESAYNLLQHNTSRAGVFTWLGGVALGGRVVPGGITLWPTCVWVTAVQLAVKEMGAVFSSTCAAQRQNSQGDL